MLESEWAADTVERRPLRDLFENARNARTHSEDQVRAIAKAIEKWGWTTPVLIDSEGTIIAGHGRVLAARLLGIEEVPCMVTPESWTDEDKRAYMLADNQIALNAGWDQNILAIEFGELQSLDFDLSLTGFSPEAISSFVAPDADPGAAGRGGAGSEAQQQSRKTLMERFGLAPFSVLSARGGWWQDRKRGWLALGIESEVGRGGNLIGRSIFERVSILISGKIGSGGTGAAYDAVRAWVIERRERGMTDEAIEAEALDLAGKGGADGAQRLAACGGVWGAFRSHGGRGGRKAQGPQAQR